MRSRMLDKPEVIATVNAECVPVKIDATDTGLPPGIPALKIWYEHYDSNPYARMIYGHFVVMNPAGTKVYGISSNQFEEQYIGKLYDGAHEYLKDYLARYRKYTALEVRAGTDEKAREELAALDAEIDLHINRRFACSRDLRLTTARFLLNYGANLWARVLVFLKPPAEGETDSLQPGLRNGILHQLGDFLVNDSPWDPYSADDVRMIYKILPAKETMALRAEILKRKKRADWTLADIPIPPSLRRKAAHGLGVILEKDWKLDDPETLAKAQSWYLAHKDDPKWQVKWADPPNGWASVRPKEVGSED